MGGLKFRNAGELGAAGVVKRLFDDLCGEEFTADFDVQQSAWFGKLRRQASHADAGHQRGREHTA